MKLTKIYQINSKNDKKGSLGGQATRVSGFAQKTQPSRHLKDYKIHRWPKKVDAWMLGRKCHIWHRWMLRLILLLWARLTEVLPPNPVFLAEIWGILVKKVDRPHLTFLSAIIPHQTRPSNPKSEKVLKTPPSAVDPLVWQGRKKTSGAGRHQANVDRNRKRPFCESFRCKQQVTLPA